MVKFSELLTRIFESYGFDITSTSEYSKYILASKDSVTISIGYKDLDERASVNDLRKFLKDAKKDRTHRKIYVSTSEYPNDMTEFANQKDIQLWDKERLEQELGKALISNLGAAEKATGSEQDAPIQNFFELIQPQTAATAAGESRTRDTSYDNIGISIPTVPIEDTGKQAEKGTEDDDEEEYRILKSRIGKEDAAKMAKKIMEGFRFDLELIPYYIYNYSCDINVGGRTPPQRNTGTIGINGLTNSMEEWPPIFETVTELDEDYTRLPPKITEEVAHQTAFESVININTKVIETKEEKDSAIIIEKKKVEPKPDAIEISRKGLVYLPAWCIEGDNGVMIIDATTGKVMKEDVFKG